ncbi:MAG: hypothetical protein ABI640_08110 [Gammaproteobacteria bacterium]
MKVTKLPPIDQLQCIILGEHATLDDRTCKVRYVGTDGAHYEIEMSFLEAMYLQNNLYAMEQNVKLLEANRAGPRIAPDPPSLGTWPPTATKH